MDAVLLAATASLTTYLPRRFLFLESSSMSKRLLRTSLALSMVCLQLSLIELLPSTWLFWFHNDNSSNNNNGEMDSSSYFRRTTTISVSTGYHWVLWAMSIYCILLVPSASGTHFISTLSRAHTDPVDHEEQKKRSFNASRDRHWTVRLAMKMAAATYSVLKDTLVQVVVVPLSRLLPTSRNSTEPALPIQVGDETQNYHRSLCSRSAVYRMVAPGAQGDDPHFTKSLVVGSLVGTATTIFLLLIVSPLVVEPNENHSASILQRTVSWLVAVGLLLSAVLNGFGSVSLPHSCLAGLFLEPIPPDSIANAEIQVETTKQTLQDRYRELSLTVATANAAAGSAPASSSSLSSSPVARQQPQTTNHWFGSVRQGFGELGDKVEMKKNRLTAEIEFLESLIDEMVEDVDEMKYASDISKRARTPAGRIRSYLGIVFSIVLLVRLVLAMSSVWKQHHSGTTLLRNSGTNDSAATTADPDPVTRVLLWILGQDVLMHPETEQLQHLKQLVSLLLTAVLSSSQMRNFLRTVTALQRRLAHVYRRCLPACSSSNIVDSKSVKANGPWFFSHLVSILLCCYSVSCIVLTKLMLPVEYRMGFSAALGDNGFQIRTYAVDTVFSVTAVLSAAVLAIILGIMRSNARRYGAMDNHRNNLMISRSASSSLAPRDNEP